MIRSFTSSFLMQNRGCYSREKVLLLPFYKESITVVDVLDSDIPVRDKCWFVFKKLMTAEEGIDSAIYVAELVLPLFELRRPGDRRARAAVEAAKAYRNGKCSLSDLRIAAAII